MDTIAAVILAGGQGRRLGGSEKALVEINDQRQIDRVLQRLKPQCSTIALSLRTPQPWAEPFDLPTLFDRPTSACGPLGGIAAALHWAQSLEPEPSWVVTVPVDLPFLPLNLIQELTGSNADISIAMSARQTHYTVAAWRPTLVTSLEQALQNGALAVKDFQAVHSSATVEWPLGNIDPFFNINTPENIKDAERYAREHGNHTDHQSTT